MKYLSLCRIPTLSIIWLVEVGVLIYISHLLWGRHWIRVSVLHIRIVFLLIYLCFCVLIFHLLSSSLCFLVFVDKNTYYDSQNYKNRHHDSNKRSNRQSTANIITRFFSSFEDIARSIRTG